MKIFLTGAEGFTGRYFIDRATAAGHQVIPMQADLTNRETLEREVLSVQPEVVVHLAAISFVGHADNSAFYAVNVVGTTNLLEALTRLPSAPHRVLLASSANIYGNSEQSPLAETQPPAPVNHYAMSKLAMEYMARTFADRLNLVIARPFNYTGVGQSPDFLIPKIVEHYARGEKQISLGNLHVARDFSDVRDVVNAYARLIEVAPRGVTVNVCSGSGQTLGALLGMLARIAGYEIEVHVDPRFVRANEVRQLIGSNAKLRSLVGDSSRKHLEDTLRWMYEEARERVLETQ